MKISIFITLFSLVLISSNYEFTLLNHLIHERPNENVIISPLSLFQSLSLVSNGARDNTQKELLKAIGQMDVYISNRKIEQIDEVVSETNGLVIANAVMSKCSPSADFIAKCNMFKATVSQLQSAKQVNDWCSSKTNGKITHILDSIANIEMIILNAVYFKGSWAKKFNPTDTKQGVFHASKGDQDVQMMYSKINAYYYEDAKVQMIELPYTEKNVTAIIVLPKKDIDQFLLKFNMDNYQGLLHYVKSDVQLTVPKFELSYESSFVEAMKSMGVSDAFDQTKADFSNINQQMKLYIDNILQKTYIKFDEEGTEAAAVTSITMTRSMPMPSLNEVMTIDRPFLLIINHRTILHANLFIAKIANIN